MKILPLMAIALSCLLTAAHADNVALYGSLDSGLRDLRNSTPAGGRIVLLNSGLYQSNRLGLSGVEDLGGGYNAHFNLESGFNIGTGALDNTVNKFFNRTDIVGMRTPAGTIDLGHMYTVAHDTLAGYEPFRLQYLSLTLASAAAAGIAGNGRDDAVVRYNGSFDKLRVRAAHAFAVPGATNGPVTAVGFSYGIGDLSFGTAFTHKSTAVVAGTPPYFGENHYTFGAAYTWGPIAVMAGRARDSLATSSARGNTVDRYTWGGFRYQISDRAELIASYYMQQDKTAGVDGRKSVAISGVTYSIAKSTFFYSDIDNTRYNGGYLTNLKLNASAHASVLGVSAGMSHGF